MPHPPDPDKERIAPRRYPMAGPESRQPRALAELFGRGTALNALREAADLRMSLVTVVRQALDADLGAEVMSCNLREDGTLVVTASSAAWATRLRFAGEQMLAACRKTHPGTTRVRVRVATESGGE